MTYRRPNWNINIMNKIIKYIKSLVNPVGISTDDDSIKYGPFMFYRIDGITITERRRVVYPDGRTDWEYRAGGMSNMD